MRLAGRRLGTAFWDRGAEPGRSLLATFCVRIPDAAAARFDRAAARAGGRSALLRRLVEQAGEGGGAAAPEPARRDGGRYMVRLAAADAAAVRAAAARMGLTPSGWIAALARRHVSGRPTFAPGQEAALIRIVSEIHRIGVNVNQIARALNGAVLEGRVLELEAAAVEALRRELRDHVEGLGEAFRGNLAYWETAF